MSLDDLPALIDLQQAGAGVGMADVFPQDQHPFPRDAILDRWRAEIADPTVVCFVAVDDNRHGLVGFAATTGRELLHFGTAIGTWGDGTASELLDVIVDGLGAGDEAPMLWV